MTHISQKQIAIIFCSYKRYELLIQAVQSLLNSDGFLKELCDVVIVDNTPKEFRMPMELIDGVRTVICEEPGLSNARNTGIAETDAPVIAFLDDDVLVGNGWLAALLQAVDAFPSASVFGGKTLALIDGDTPNWFSNALTGYLSCIDWGDVAKPLVPGQWVVGANIAYRRTVFEQFGLFDPSLGRKGQATLLSNEETALMRRVGLASTQYLPDMCVQHIIPADRLQRAWFRKRASWQAMSDLLSGEGYLTPDYASRLFNEFVAKVPADYRSLRCLYYDIDDPRMFDEQLRAIYYFGVIFGEGFPGDPTSVGGGL